MGETRVGAEEPEASCKEEGESCRGHAEGTAEGTAEAAVGDGYKYREFTDKNNNDIKGSDANVETEEEGVKDSDRGRRNVNCEDRGDEKDTEITSGSPSLSLTSCNPGKEEGCEKNQESINDGESQDESTDGDESTDKSDSSEDHSDTECRSENARDENECDEDSKANMSMKKDGSNSDSESADDDDDHAENDETAEASLPSSFIKNDIQITIIDEVIEEKEKESADERNEDGEVNSYRVI